MIRGVALSLLVVFIIISCAQVKQARQTHQFQPRPNAIPELTILNDTSASALRISNLTVQVNVAANIATTTFDIHFYNPNDRQLEGEFEFPLADGQHITRYALDIDGKLREGVVVEKARARIAFENTIRAKIDPGMVEQTKGNNFRTRIYPLPARGYRHIVIAFEQALPQENGDIIYQLPLYAKETIDTFGVNVTVLKSEEQPQLDAKGLAGMRFKKVNTSYTAAHHAKNFTANETLSFAIPASGGNQNSILTEKVGDQMYFYVSSIIEPQYKEKKKPASIGLYWDISGSAAQRNIDKEMELIRQYIKELGVVKVDLIPFNIYTEPKETFEISNGNSDDLINKLKTFVYEGGTQLGALDLSQAQYDEVIVFTDGLSTFGKEEINIGGAPVIVVASAASANYSYLKNVAQKGHGMFVDLSRLDINAALKEINAQALQVINVLYDKNEVLDLAMQTTALGNSGLSFAGKLASGSADITVELGFGNKVVETKTFTIKQTKDSEYDQVKRIWATMAIAELEMQYEKNKKRITSLGKEFSVVTQNTSLIVLDRVEDYVEHEIIPPADLLEQYNALVHEKYLYKQDDKKTAMDEALLAMEELKEWWNTDFKSEKSGLKNTPAEIQYARPVLDSAIAMGTYSFSTTGDDATSTAPSFETEGNTGYRSADKLASPGPVEEYKLSPKEKQDEPVSAINVNEWKPDLPYLKILEQAAPSSRMSKYLSLKKQYSRQPSFFVDAARFFIEKNEKKLGILILSNVNEMKLEDAELLRLVGNQLLDAGEKELALETFLQVLRQREEDPQSYRDLALAYSENGNYNKAIEYLYQLITGTWDQRFGDVKAIALNEMNAIISAHRSLVNTAAIDARLIYAMPVDVRIVVGWNADNADIDLWVTDPRKEKCYYSNPATGLGGKISKDVTQGYGPEEYILKKATDGDYTIEVNLFGESRQTLGGPIAIKAELFTDFGKPTQKRKMINLRVTESKEVVKIGSLSFGS